MIKAKRDLINAIVILLFCGFAYYGTLLIPVRSLGKTEADFFPKIVIGLVVFLSICLLISSLVRMTKEKNSKLGISFQKLIKENKKVILTFVIFAAYVFLLDYIGYFVSSILFLYALYLLIAPKKTKQWAVLLGITLFTSFFYFIFQNLLSVFLPTGVLF